MALTQAHKYCYEILAMIGKSVKVFANASAAAPPAVYFAKTFTDFPT